MGAKPDREIVVQNAVRSASVPSAANIRRWVGRALGEAQPGEVTVRVVDEAESAHLNERYRRGCGATDVLAFAYGDPTSTDTDPPGTRANPAGCGGKPDLADEERAFGDLVICAAVVERELAGAASLDLFGPESRAAEEASFTATGAGTVIVVGAGRRAMASRSTGTGG